MGLSTQQEGQSQADYGGTGLGLAIIKRLVEMLEGCISIETPSGPGTIFIIKLDNVEIHQTIKEEKDETISEKKIYF